jgi:hypothetical protein
VESSVHITSHREALWNALLDADMNVCYWGWISDRCTKWDSWLKFVVALTASGTVAGWGIWSQFPAGWKGLSAVACVAALGHPIFFPSERLKRISGLVATWKEIYTDYELLWEQDSELCVSDSWNRFEANKRREASIDETNLPKTKKLIRKAYESVRRKRGLDGRQEISTTTAKTKTT